MKPRMIINNGFLTGNYANRSMFAGLDLARNDWTATTVAPGPLEFVWTNTASHRTTYFRYYITKPGCDPAGAPLKWSDLELIHDSGPEPQQTTSTHVVNLPQRSGKHIVYAIWHKISGMNIVVLSVPGAIPVGLTCLVRVGHGQMRGSRFAAELSNKMFRCDSDKNQQLRLLFLFGR